MFYIHLQCLAYELRTATTKASLSDTRLYRIDKVTSARITYLRRRQVAESRVRALQRGLLNDSVSAISVGHIIGSDAVLSVESTSEIRNIHFQLNDAQCSL